MKQQEKKRSKSAPTLIRLYSAKREDWTETKQQY